VNAINTNAFSCLGSTWSIENSTVTTEDFQKYLFATQNTCNRRIWQQPIGSAGIGATMKEAINLFAFAFECGMIYRPSDAKPYLFADFKKQNCNSHIRSIDCYFEPLSSCGTDLTKPILTEEDSMSLSLLPPKIDACTTARLLKRPISWLKAQILEYIIRPGPILAKEMKWRVEKVFENYNPQQFSSIAIQMRTGDGELLDGGRAYIPSLDRYMEAIDYYAEQLATINGRSVGIVYLSSNAPLSTYKSVEYMTSTYPRNFTYAEIPHTSFGKNDLFNTLQSGIAHNNSFRESLEKSTSIFDLTVEYFTDIDIYSQADIYIGGTSSVSDVVFLLRTIRIKDNNKNNTCIVDLTTKENPLICGIETQKARHYWSERFRYEGGVMF